ncbi:MAG: hypothetical protein GY771_04985 [bacterium]|nr:hypothetical protein [bacterium]
MKQLIGLTTILVALIAILGACDDDTIIPPTTGSVSGTATFTGEWPVGTKGGEADAVYVCIFTEWPIDSAPILSAPLQEPGSDGKIAYKVDNVSLGTYAVIGMWTFPQYEFLGAYGYENEGDTPTPITLTEENANLTGIDFDASYGGASETGSISGHVSFSGTWPDGNVRVMAFETWPPSGAPQMTDPISEATEFDYTIADVPYNTYGVVGLFDAESNMYGAYGFDPPGDTTPDPVTVDAGTPNPSGIDFDASN